MYNNYKLNFLKQQIERFDRDNNIVDLISTRRKMAGEAPLYISSCMIKELVSMKDVVGAMQDALRWFSEGGQVVQPVRTVVSIEQHSGRVSRPD